MNSKNNLIRNIERRGKLLQNIRGSESEKDIIIKANFEKFLDKVEKRFPIEEERQKIYQKIFTILNRSAEVQSNKKPSTSNATSILDYSGIKYLKELGNFGEIKNLFNFIINENIPLSSITGMQHGKGIPNKKELEEFVDTCKELKIDIKSITGMQNGKGIPNKKELEKFVDTCKELEIDISSITGMQHGKGIPNKKELVEFVDTCKELEIDIKSITSKQLGIKESIRYLSKLKN